MSTLPQKMIVISGWGAYPRLIVEGAHAALHLAEGHDVLAAAAEQGRECLSVVAGEA